MKLELTHEQIDIILNYLSVQPYNVVSGIINEIVAQINKTGIETVIND